MFLRRHVCRLPPHKNTPNEFVWTSEDVLDSAISDFSRGKISRRRVGLVPGPLEARKRAAKRRMMNLAQGGGGGEIDASLLRGVGRAPGQASWQWQSPTTPAWKDTKNTAADPNSMGSMLPIAKDNKGSATWLRWLAKFDSNEAKKAPPEDEEPSGNIQGITLAEKQACLEGADKSEPVEVLVHASTLHEDVPISGPSPPAFEPLLQHQSQSILPFDHRLRGMDLRVLEALKTCASLEEIRTWAMRHNVYSSKYSRQAFLQLFSLKPPLHTLLEALEDVPLRHPRNLKYLLASITEQPQSQTDTDLVSQWVKRRASLGMLSELEISHLAHSVSSGSTLPCQKQWQCSLAGSLFDGLQSSTVLGLEDVEPGILELLWRPISESLLISDPQDIGTRIIKALQPSQAEWMRSSIASFIQRLIQAQATSQGNDVQEVYQLNAIPWAVDMIRNLPQNVAKSVVLSICGALIEDKTCSTIGRRVLVKLLTLWWSELAKSGLVDFTYENPTRTQIERMLSKSWAENMGNDPALAVITSYMRVLNDFNKARFILQYCYESDMSSPRTAQVLRRFAEWRRERAMESPFISMMRVAQEQSMLVQLQTVRVFRLLQMLHMSRTVTHIVSNAKEANYDVGEYAVLRAIRNHMRVYPQMAQRLFEAYPQLPLEKCPELAEKLISNPEIHPKWPLVYYRSRHPGPGVPSCREPLSTIRARARLLGRMALAYARDMTMSHRAAFREVYRCYQLHMNESLGPLGTDIVSAFTDTGIIRPLQERQWVSTVKLRWILSLIRSVEGADVAAQVDSLVYKWRGHAIVKSRAECYQDREHHTSLARDESWDFETV
ncbi:hypothetical protein N7G274_002658 [Stereocaulon virgatum]|uniref:Uncharacterized protein n=1 Tax=Stereocaulon virgatum TaxID=373712 RepID=A0ABR4AIG1_9LECA